MKNYWLALLAITIFFSCKSKTSSSLVDSSASQSGLDIESKALRQKFKPIIQGDWVRNDYINAIKKNHSPYESRMHLKGVASILIDMTDATPNSVEAGCSLNDHEGSNFTVLFEPGQKANTLKTKLPDYYVQSNFYELGYTVSGRDTSLILYHYNSKKQLLDSLKYTRALKSVGNDAAGGLTHMVNHALFSGNYVATDSTGHKLYIQFTDEGKVYGFLKFKDYYANTDFMAGPANNIDQLDFDVNTKDQKEYNYKLLADTLTLYAINYNADSTVQSRGGLKYKLVKQK